MPTEHVLVTDVDRRQGIETVRSLGRRGIDVTAASSTLLASGWFSKYASRRLRHPDPAFDEPAFLDALERELRERSYDALIPVTSPTVGHVISNRDRLEAHAPIPYPPSETLMAGLDKRRTLAAARAVGVPTPETMAPETLDLDTVATTIGYPVIVKPYRGAGRKGVARCESPAELESAFKSVSERFGQPLLQEFIPNGGEYGVYTMYDWSSALVGLTVQHRLRSNPPRGGPSTLRETVENPELVDHARELFDELGWSGVAMAEFRYDDRTGEPMFLEVNPRLWGSLALSIYAGVDFPFLLYQLAVDGSCDPMLEYRAGVQARQLLGDVGHLLRRTDRVDALREFLSRGDAPRTYDIFSRDDPRVAVGYTANSIAGFLERMR